MQGVQLRIVKQHHYYQLYACVKKDKIVVRILSQKGIYKYNESMINVWGINFKPSID